MYSLLIGVIYLTFISLGLPDSLLGSGWPAMHLDLQLPVSYMGYISMVISGMTILSSLYADKLTRKFGTRRVTTYSVLLTAVALFGYSFSNSFWWLLVFSIPYGLGAGAIDAALNGYVAKYYSSRQMSWLHCFWGAGAIISPYVMSYTLGYGSWSDGYRIIGLVQMGIFFVLLLSIPLWKIHQNKEDMHAEGKALSLSQALKIKGVPYLLLGFFGYCAAEATTMLWASTYLVEVRNLDTETAAAFGALFYIGLSAGRFFGGFFMDKIGDRRMIRLGVGVLVAGILLVLLPVESPVFALCGFVTVGLGCAPIYPCIIHATPGNFGAENAGAIIGIQMASAYVGSTFVPPLFGLLGKWAGMESLPFFLFAFTALTITMTEKTFQITQK